ncbi:hypothetical protein JOD54_000910 [Actinokineospora baliensis]|uniref:hypothetical protein n=1 Tax=Actinokineospora baliensis TaxID=547056 RepID=UPI00195CB257|nr:hypothetical protein [Actinokineospora baliensis]MBM7770706.1 hypothetical protein [Actinokineospora baliensis]
MKLGRLGGGAAAAVLAAAAVATLAPAAQADGQYWSCRRVPAGTTYTMARADQGCEPLFYIATPVTGLWACTVPAGFTYTATKYDTSCAMGGSTTKYLLAKI